MIGFVIKTKMSTNQDVSNAIPTASASSGKHQDNLRKSKTVAPTMEYHSSFKASCDAFEQMVSNLSITIKHLQEVCVKVDKNKSWNKEAASRLALMQDKFGLLVPKFSELLKEFNSFDVPTIDVPWLENEKSSKLDMTFVRGGNPWEFFLTYCNKEKLNQINEHLNSRRLNNSLRKFVSPPEEGQLVVTCTGKELARAKILKRFPSGRLRILKLDSCEEGLVLLSDIYECPLELTDIPCQTLRCCLNKEDQFLQERWCADLDLIFTKPFSDCQLTVDILETLPGFSPPKFYVRIYGYNDNLSEEVNLSSWINAKLLAALKSINPDADDDIMTVLGEECIDPFFSGSPKVENDVVEYELATSSLNINPLVSPNMIAIDTQNPSLVPDIGNRPGPQTIDECGNLDEPHPDLVGLSLEKVSTWMEQYTDEETIRLNQKIIKYEVPALEEPSFSFSKIKKEPLRDPSITGNTFSSNASSSASTEKDVPPSLKVEKSSPSSSSKMSISAPEFMPRCYVEVIPGEYETSFENVISNLEDEYQPKDENRICQLYKKKGSCYRIGCNKEHTLNTDGWTNDKEEIERGPYNNLDLPREGSTTFLRVEHVENANSFFATLHSIYSDINEYGVRETLETLYRDLNSCDSTSPHPLLKTTPTEAEVVLALGLQRTLGPRRKWLRATVSAIFDACTMEVFFIDFGNKEIVPIKDVRQIRPQFLHLPAQAVRTTLSSLKIVPEQRQAGKVFLAKLIKGKTLKADIVIRDVLNTELDVIMFTEDDICINNLMVEKNFCVPC